MQIRKLEYSFSCVTYYKDMKKLHKVDTSIHNLFMADALLEAEKALKSNDVPIGAIIVKDSEIIGRGYNQVERRNDPTYHAELIAIRQALSKTAFKRLPECTIYVTLEPCPMCAGAILLARIPIVVFGTDDPKSGACGSLFNLLKDSRLNHRCEIVSGIMKSECSELVTKFFRDMREYREK